MAIGSSQIDTSIATALYEKEQKLLEESSSSSTSSSASSSPAESSTTGDEAAASSPPPKVLTAEEKRAEAVLLKRGAKKGTTFKEKAGMTLSGIVLCAFGFLLWKPMVILAGVCYFIGALLLLGGIFSAQRQARSGSRQGEAVLYTSDVLDALLPLLELTPVEKRYGALLSVLAREPSPLDDATRMDMVEQVNGLLNDHRALLARRTEIEYNLSATDIAGMEAERDRLRAEAAKADDSVVQEARLQTSRMLEERLEDARVVRRTAERMRAQEDAVYETMGTLHSSLTRLSLAPTGLEKSATSALRDAVDRTRRQTQAVEQAVQEVASVSPRQ